MYRYTMYIIISLCLVAYIKEMWIASRVWPRPSGQFSDRASGQTMMASQIQHEGQAADAILPADESAVRRSCTIGQFHTIADKTTTIITIKLM